MYLSHVVIHRVSPESSLNVSAVIRSTHGGEREERGERGERGKREKVEREEREERGERAGDTSVANPWKRVEIDEGEGQYTQGGPKVSFVKKRLFGVMPFWPTLYEEQKLIK